MELRWRELEGALVVAERSVGRETVEVSSARVGKGEALWLLPTTVTFRDVFTDRDRRWGPESLKLSKWSVHEIE